MSSSFDGRIIFRFKIFNEGIVLQVHIGAFLGHVHVFDASLRCGFGPHVPR